MSGPADRQSSPPPSPAFENADWPEQPPVSAGPACMRLVLLGDIHNYALGIWPWELLGKTFAGQMNLWLNRRRKFDRTLLAPTVARALACKPDMVVLSGDLTTTARSREFAPVAVALQPLLDAAPAVLLPGNHDRYTFTSLRRRRIERCFPRCVPEPFPHARPLIGRWRLLAVDAAVPRLFDSRGRIGNRQLQHARAIIESVQRDDGLLVLCHYPFGKPPSLPPMKAGHRLLDEDAWREAILSCRGRVILVHGHVHCPWLWRVENDGATRVLDINAGSPTMVSSTSGSARHVGDWPRGQGFWEMQLPANPAQPIALTHHVMAAGAAPLGMDAAPDTLSAPAPAGAGDRLGWAVRRTTITL